MNYLDPSFVNLIDHLAKYSQHIAMIVCCFRTVKRGRLGRDHMVVEFTTTYAISAYHH